MKKVPMRSCVVTKEKLPKNELVRVVKTDEGVIVDLTGKVNGHGVYLKKNAEVITTAKSKKVLDHMLETSVPDSVFEELMNIVK